CEPAAEPLSIDLPQAEAATGSAGKRPLPWDGPTLTPGAGVTWPRRRCGRITRKSAHGTRWPSLAAHGGRIAPLRPRQRRGRGRAAMLIAAALAIMRPHPQLQAL